MHASFKKQTRQIFLQWNEPFIRLFLLSVLVRGHSVFPLLWLHVSIITDKHVISSERTRDSNYQIERNRQIDGENLSEPTQPCSPRPPPAYTVSNHHISSLASTLTSLDINMDQKRGPFPSKPGTSPCIYKLISWSVPPVASDPSPAINRSNVRLRHYHLYLM